MLVCSVFTLILKCFLASRFLDIMIQGNILFYIAALEYVEHDKMYSFTAKMIMPHKQKNIDMQNIDIYSR